MSATPKFSSFLNEETYSPMEQWSGSGEENRSVGNNFNQDLSQKIELTRSSTELNLQINLANSVYVSRRKKQTNSENISHENFSAYESSFLDSDYIVDNENKIGEGAFSTVYMGTHIDSGDRVAIKTVNITKMSEDEKMQLEREIEILLDVKHPNILVFLLPSCCWIVAMEKDLIDVYKEPEKLYLTTELMSGGDLFDYIEKHGFLVEHKSQYICKSLLSAVSHLHSQSIAHRDIKPENILLSSPSKSGEFSIKLADFGFAKRESVPNSFTTLCGTPAYVAPEILQRVPYGTSVDMWSLGVVCYTMLSGYQPFHSANEKEVEQLITKGRYHYDHKFWKNITKTAKDFIGSLLEVDAKARSAAHVAMHHSWMNMDLSNTLSNEAAQEDEQHPVFFMIGSQRSGSNWLRTMLDQREDLVGPHPPHIMREFMPIIEKFGNLANAENMKILVDHVCTFVERNQVPWTDKHGQGVIFCRHIIYKHAKEACSRLEDNRCTKQAADEQVLLEKELYLLSIFDAIMNYYAQANSKRLWMCKSMGMSKYHKFLLDFYGEKRLRYIYLVRDPRDVAMSFMKTPVGDCHWYAIISKWVNLQKNALHILTETPHLIHKIHYEDLLANKQYEVEAIYNFIGERRFGGMKRQASVMFMCPSSDLISGAKVGRESMKAHTLSYQFKNLVRGDSFRIEQQQKWCHPKTGLGDEELQIIETVAWEMMKYFNYETKLVGKDTSPSIFSEEQIKEFAKLNEVGIKKMMEDLKIENVEDYKRRSFQAKVLSFEPKLLSDWEVQVSTSSKITLSLIETINVEDEKVGNLVNGSLHFKVGAASMKGYYPDNQKRTNQDQYDIRINIDNSSTHYFAVYDGHGPNGHHCAQFAKKNIPDLFLGNLANEFGTIDALEKAHLDAHDLLIESDEMDTKLSGTTSTAIFLDRDHLTISNVGDSVAILGSKNPVSGTMTASLLAKPHDLSRMDEAARIKSSGGLVLSAEEYDGLPERKNSLPRVWSQESMDKLPGCAFTRSLGDDIAHELGVSARPEFHECQLEEDQVLVIASDGLTEFMDAQRCIDIACQYDDPTLASEALIKASLGGWAKQNDYVDDITVIVVYLIGGDK